MRISSQNLRKAIMLLTSFNFYACSQDRVETICRADGSCRIESSGAEIGWDLSNLKAGKEYFLVLRSQASVSDARSLSHSVFFSTKAPSAQPSKSEIQVNSMIARTPSGADAISLMNLNNTILPPHAGAQNIGDEIPHFYIPNPDDYTTKFKESAATPLWFPTPSNTTRSGVQGGVRSIAIEPGLFEMSVNNSEAQTAQLADNISRLEKCLKRVLPEAIHLLGRPRYQLNSTPELKVVLTQFAGKSGSRTLGLFSSIDRFKTNRGKNIPDSNKGDILYLKTPENYSQSCSTAAHEYQHLVSFDHKVLSKLPEKNRFDMAEQTSRNIQPESLGLNEGYSHIIEELSEEAQIVSGHVYKFLTKPNGASFALEAAWENPDDNSRSRGLNTLLHYYGIRRAGGSLNASDPQTQNYLKSLIESPNTGIQNIAEYFKTDEANYIHDFFSQFAVALYQPDQALKFIPPQENTGGVTRGIKFLNRSEPFERIPFTTTTIHPMQVTAPLVTHTNSFTVPAQAVIFLKYIVPPQRDASSQLKISTSGKPFTFYAIPAR